MDAHALTLKIKEVEMEIALLVKVRKGREEEVLKTIRSYGYHANLMIGQYDVFVETLSSLQQLRDDIREIPGISQVTLMPQQKGPLYAS